MSKLKSRFAGLSGVCSIFALWRMRARNVLRVASACAALLIFLFFWRVC